MRQEHVSLGISSELDHQLEKDGIYSQEQGKQSVEGWYNIWKSIRFVGKRMTQIGYIEGRSDTQSREK